jgi:hypothetical protein
MTSTHNVAGPATARRYAACLAVVLGTSIAACVPSLGAPLSTSAPPPDYALPAVGAGIVMAQAGPERGLTKEQFIERRRQAAIRQGKNPEQAAAMAPRLFDMIDTNHDGIIDRAEIAAFRAAHPGIGGGPGGAPPPGGAPMPH